MHCIKNYKIKLELLCPCWVICTKTWTANYWWAIGHCICTLFSAVIYPQVILTCLPATRLSDTADLQQQNLLTPLPAHFSRPVTQRVTQMESIDLSKQNHRWIFPRSERHYNLILEDNWHLVSFKGNSCRNLLFIDHCHQSLLSLLGGLQLILQMKYMFRMMCECNCPNHQA